MIRSLYRAQDAAVRTDLTPNQFAKALADDSGLLWVDLGATPAEEAEPILHDTFGFHPLAVDDALRETHVPKVDDWGEYITVVLHAVHAELESDDPLTTCELDLFLGRNFLVTYQVHPIVALDRVWEHCLRDDRYVNGGPARLMYRIADELVADYMPAIEEIDSLLDEIETRVFENPANTPLGRIFRLKRALLDLRRTMSPQREVLNKLARGDYAVIDVDDRAFFRDVYDHVVRLNDISESLRDEVSTAMEIYLSVVNNRLNETMRTLTLITTLFMPLTFVTGFFGMNFFQPVGQLSAWTGRLVFVVALLAMVVTPAVMYFWMRKRMPM